MQKKNKQSFFWYALFVKKKQENKVEKYINELNNPHLKAYVPSVVRIKQWSDRKVKTILPLIPSIVFVNSNEENRNKVFSIPGTAKYLFINGKPAIVKDYEIKHLKTLIDSESKRQIKKKLNLGDNINLEAYGISTNGIIEKISNNAYWIVIENLGIKIKITNN